MKINEINKETLETLVRELLNLNGAKEIFEKYDIEVINFSTEKAAFEKLIKEFDKKVKESKAVKEYKQAVAFLNLQINTNREALKTAEGFVKNMIESMLQTFESSKNTTKDIQSATLRTELVGLENIVLNDKDKEVVKELLSKVEITKEDDFVEQIENLIKKAKERYSEDVKAETKKTDKEVIKKDNEKLHKEVVKELDNLEKKKEKEEEVEKELNNLKLEEEEKKKEEKKIDTQDLNQDNSNENKDSDNENNVLNELNNIDLSDLDGVNIFENESEEYNPFQ